VNLDTLLKVLGAAVLVLMVCVLAVLLVWFAAFALDMWLHVMAGGGGAGGD
jgi:hypothetical protein